MKIVFCSLIYDRDKEDFYKGRCKDGQLQHQCNTFQYAIIDGLEENSFLDEVYVINSLSVGIYGKYYKDLFLHREKIYYNNSEIGVTIPCVNFHVFKQYTRYINSYREIKKYIKKNLNEEIYLLTYNEYSPYIRACVRLVKKYPNVKLCPIITDMPGEFGILPEKWWQKKYVLMQSKKTLKRLTYADRFIFLTEYMKNPLNVKDKYMIMEGIYSSVDKDNKIEDNIEHENKVILYTGALNKQYGILDLIEAFNKINRSDLELWICGASGNVAEVKAEAKKNNRIKYFGDVPRSTVIKYQRSADLLVNPRPNNEEFVKYSFPSKTMEYLASGKPVLMHKLFGIPDEYDQYLNYFTSDNTENMAKDMENILYGNYKKYIDKANNARTFILEKKNSKVQVARILEFLDGEKEND